MLKLVNNNNKESSRLGKKKGLRHRGLFATGFVVLVMTALTSCAYNAAISPKPDGPEVDILKEAEIDIAGGNYSEALKHCTEAMEANPQSDRAYRLRAYVKWMSGDPPSALRDINKAIEINPKAGRSYHVRARIEDFEESFSEAIADYSRAIDLGSSTPDAAVYTERGFARIRKGDLAGASDDFSKALRLNALNPRAKQGERVVRLMQKGIPPFLNDTGIIALFTEMAEPLPRCTLQGGGIKLSTKYRTPHLRLGLEACENMYFDAAVTHFTRAIELSPGLPEAYNNRGFTYSQQDSADLAIKDFIKALAIDPDFAPARRNLDDLFRKLNELPKFVRKIQGMLSRSLSDLPKQPVKVFRQSGGVKAVRLRPSL